MTKEQEGKRNLEDEDAEDDEEEEDQGSEGEGDADGDDYDDDKLVPCVECNEEVPIELADFDEDDGTYLCANCLAQDENPDGSGAVDEEDELDVDEDEEGDEDGDDDDEEGDDDQSLLEDEDASEDADKPAAKKPRT